MAFENTTDIAGSLPEFPITTLTTLLSSFTGLQGWLTLILIGSVFRICQRIAPHAWDAILDLFWVTIEFDQLDDEGTSYRECLFTAPALMPPLSGADHALPLQAG